MQRGPDRSYPLVFHFLLLAGSMALSSALLAAFLRCQGKCLSRFLLLLKVFQNAFLSVLGFSPTTRYYSLPAALSEPIWRCFRQ